MITRENLIQAIYDNDDEWSCQSPCPHTMEEVKPECVCYTCAEQKLKEYEDSICRNVIEKCAEVMANHMRCFDCMLDCNEADIDTCEENLRLFLEDLMKGEAE